jgi:hypothetical protein
MGHARRPCDNVFVAAAAQCQDPQARELGQCRRQAGEIGNADKIQLPEIGQEAQRSKHRKLKRVKPVREPSGSAMSVPTSQKPSSSNLRKRVMLESFSVKRVYTKPQ